METYLYHLDMWMYPNVSSTSTSGWLFYPGLCLHTPPASIFIKSLHTLESSI